MTENIEHKKLNFTNSSKLFVSGRHQIGVKIHLEKLNKNFTSGKLYRQTFGSNKTVCVKDILSNR